MNMVDGIDLDKYEPFSIKIDAGTTYEMDRNACIDENEVFIIDGNYVQYGFVYVLVDDISATSGLVVSPYVRTIGRLGRNQAKLKIKNAGAGLCIITLYKPIRGRQLRGVTR